MSYLPVIPVMIIGVMRLSYNERAVSEGRFRHHLFQAVFVWTTYPSRYVHFRWSRVHTAVETAVTATVIMWERCKSWVQLEASEIGEIQVPVAHECKVLSRPDLYQFKDLFLKIFKRMGDTPIKFGAISPWSYMFCGFGAWVTLCNLIFWTLFFYITVVMVYSDIWIYIHSTYTGIC